MLGTGFAFSLSLVLFAIVSVIIFAIRIERPRTGPLSGGSLYERVVEGIAFVRRKKELLGAISLDLFAVLLGGATALLPFFAQEVLHVGPMGFGVLKAAPAIGAAAMSFWLTARPIQGQAGLKMFACVAVFGVATIVFGLSENFYLSLAALITLGASDMVSVNVRHSLTQLATPDHMRGRVSAVNSVFIGASNQLGEFESGATAALLGPVGSVLLGGIGTLVVAGLWLRLDGESVAAVRMWEDPMLRAGGLFSGQSHMKIEDGDLIYGAEQKLPIFGKPALARRVAAPRVGTT